MPFTFNAIFYRAAPSKNFEPAHLLSGSEAGLPPDPAHDRILATAAVNVSMPLQDLLETMNHRHNRSVLVTDDVECAVLGRDLQR